MEKSKNNQTKLTYVLFAVNFLILVWVILFKMQFSLSGLPDFRGFNLIPFAGSVIKNNRLDYNEILLNFIVFVPFGLYLGMIKPGWTFWKKTAVIAGVSVLFELVQYAFAIGGADITDLIGNTLGGIAGMAVYAVFSKKLKEKTNKVINIFALIGTILIVISGLVLRLLITYKF